jgi:CRP/FNR family transcriptional regulator
MMTINVRIPSHEGLSSVPLPVGRAGAATALRAFTTQAVRIQKGARVFQAGDPFKGLYCVSRGCFKSTVSTAGESEQITGFLMSGDVMGLDAMASGFYGGSSLALEDGELELIPSWRLSQLIQHDASFHQSVCELMSDEIVRAYGMLATMSHCNAEQRLAAFLLSQSQRYSVRGYSGIEFNLKMSRDDIADAIGVRAETVCRSITRLRDLGLARFQGRRVKILDMDALRSSLRDQ